MKGFTVTKDKPAVADLIPAEMKPPPAVSEDVRPHALLDTDELLARFGDRAGAHGPNSTLKKPFMVRIPKDAALSWIFLARKLGTRPATLMAQLLVAASTVSPSTWHSSVAALQRSAKHIPPDRPGDYSAA